MKIPSFLSILALVQVCFILSAQEETPADKPTAGVESQPWKMFAIETKASLRGLHVLSQTDVWASGTGGTIVHTADGGLSWRVQTVAGAEKLDFRDLHAIDQNTIVAMTSGTPARIYRSTDGGSHWQLCYENKDERVFLDALSFIDDQRGFVMGDPIDESLFLLQTSDAGKTWTRVKDTPPTLPGEGGFAASGSNMAVFGNRKIAIAMGSALPGQTQPTCRVLVSENGTQWTANSVPLMRSPSAGIFSICFANANDGVVVGGDYKQPDNDAGNFAVTRDGGKTWSIPQMRTPPTGFRSCVATLASGDQVHMVTVGTNGTDLSTDLGESWRRISDQGFHAVEFTPDGKHGWATGGDGKIAKWQGIDSRKSD